MEKGTRFVLASILLMLLVLSLNGPALGMQRSSALSQAPSNASTYTVNDRFFISTFDVSLNNLGTMTISYLVVSAAVSNSSVAFPPVSGNARAAVDIVTNADTYAITPLSGTVSGMTNVIVKSGEQFSVTSPAQLMRVNLVQNDTVEGVWAGYLNSPGTVSGYAYYNPNIPATLELEYENGTSTASFPIFLSGGTSYSVAVGNLARVSASLISNSSSASEISFQFPVRYEPMSLDLNSTFSSENTFNLGSIASSLSLSSSYKPSLAYFNGATVPAIDWEIKGSGTFYSGLFSINETAIAMYGINGNQLGFVNSLYGTSYLPFGSSGYYELSVASTTIVVANNPSLAQAGPFTSSSFKVGNSTAIVLVDSKGEVESTANITASHNIFANKSGTLVGLQINSTTQYVVIFQNKSSDYVNLVTPQSETNSTFTVSGKNYTADKVVVNGSGYIVFYVPITASGSYQVYKMTSSGSVQLDSRNYYTLNGNVVVFDDPSTIYYIVYGVPTGAVLTLIEEGIGIAVIVALLGIFFIKRGVRAKSFPT
jgi:hypothetical protein